MNSELTYPHDYRVIAGSEIHPTIVGGQAVNLWAITFLESNQVDPSTKYGSADLDILTSPRILDFLRTLEPKWQVDKIPIWNFGDGRAAIARSLTDDKRPLLVEVMKSVHGLDAADIAATDEIEYAGTTFRLLDPISLLKSKAANLRDFSQEGPPPRHDRTHLHLIARCFPLYLRHVHERAIGKAEAERVAADLFSRAFATLSDRKTAKILDEEKIDRPGLMPAELADSPIEKVRSAYKWQLPRLRTPA